jgi:hypothetical protein
VARIVEEGRSFRADRAWGALDVAEAKETTDRLHWTDRAYESHVNDGKEVFAVIDDIVDMKYRVEGSERSVRLEPGSICVAELGDEYVAHPLSEACILFIERKGSI